MKIPQENRYNFAGGRSACKQAACSKMTKLGENPRTESTVSSTQRTRTRSRVVGGKLLMMVLD